MMVARRIANFIENAYIFLNALVSDTHREVRSEVDLLINMQMKLQFSAKVSLLLDFYIWDNINENGYISNSLTFLCVLGTEC